MIELKVLRRDLNGKPIPENYIEYCSESAEEVADWFEKNVLWARKGQKYKHKRKKKNENEQQTKSEVL